MTSEGMPRPYAVAAMFSDGQQSNLQIAVHPAVTPEHAASMTVSQYYMAGGKLPLQMTTVLTIQRESLNAAIQMLEAIEERDKAEEAKVVSIVPGPPPQDQPA